MAIPQLNTNLAVAPPGQVPWHEQMFGQVNPNMLAFAAAALGGGIGKGNPLVDMLSQTGMGMARGREMQQVQQANLEQTNKQQTELHNILREAIGILKGDDSSLTLKNDGTLNIKTSAAGAMGPKPAQPKLGDWLSGQGGSTLGQMVPANVGGGTPSGFLRSLLGQ